MASIDQIQIPNGTTYDLAPILEKLAINSFDGGVDSYFKKVKSTIVPVQAGSGTPSPTNVRTISGFTECMVTDNGKNLLNNVATSQTITGVTFTINSDKSVNVNTPSPATEAFTQLTIGEITLKANTSYTLSGCPSGGGGTSYRLYILGKSAFPQVLDDGSGATFTPSEDVTTEVRIIVYRGATVSNKVFYPMIRLSSDTATDYTPYVTPTTATISFGSAGTVYGGEVDLTTGVLTVDRGYLQPTSIQQVATSGSKVYWVVANNLTSINGVNGLMSSHFEPASGVAEGHCYITGNGVILVAVPTDQTLNTPELANTWLSTNQPQFVYPLATPQTYQLTPAQLRSLVGTNNLTSNTGDTVEVEYITNETIADIYDELYEQGETIYTIVKNESELTTALSTPGSNILVTNAFNLTHTINITQNNTNLTFNKNVVFNMTGKNFAFITVGANDSKPTYVNITNPKAMGDKTSGSIGINLLGMGFGGSINSPTLQSFDVGIKTNSFDCAQLISLYEPVVQGCNIGIDDSLGGLQAVRIYGGRIEGNTNWGVKIGSPNVNFMGTVIEGNGTNLSNGGEVYFTNVSTNRSSAVFVNCYFETSSTTNGNIITANSNWLGNVSLTNCEIYNLAVPVVKYTGSDTKERAINIIGGNVKGTVMVNLPNVGSSTSVFISNVLYDDSTNAIDANISASANKFISGKNVSTTSIIRGKSFMSGNTKDGVKSAENVYSKILQIDTPSGNNNFIRLTQSASNPWADASVGILKGSLHYNSATNKWYQRITSKGTIDAEANWSPLILATTPHTEISTSGSGNSLYFAMPNKSQWLGKKICICAWRTAESDVNKNPPKFMWEFYVPTNWSESSDDFDIYSSYRGGIGTLDDTRLTVNLDYTNNRISLQDDGFYARNLNGGSFYIYLHHSLMTYKLVII